MSEKRNNAYVNESTQSEVQISRRMDRMKEKWIENQ